jgi:hypothetical protein
MKAGKAYPLFVGAILAVLGSGWFLFSEFQRPVQAERVEAIDLRGSGILDGMTFASELGPRGEPADVEDSLVFADGMFVSTECELRCDYPARPYFVRQNGDRIEFVSETRCPHKDAKIVWRGTVDDKTIKGTATWTLSRWYWTIEKEFWFEGTLAKPETPVAHL